MNKVNPKQLAEERDEDSERRELEALSEQAFLRIFQVALNCDPKERYKPFSAVAQSIGTLIGLLFANRGHAKLAGDIGCVIRDFANSLANLTDEERQVILNKAISDLNNEAKPSLIMPVTRRLN